MSQPAGQSFFDRIPSSNDAQACKNLYDEWAKTYDHDLTDSSHDYVAPTQTAQAIVKAGGNLNGDILDAGCGTGLAGVAVSLVGGKTIDGIDISTGMLEIAGKTGVYRDLKTADLNGALDIGTGVYDVVLCVGTLTAGHVGAKPAIEEFVRVLKVGGLLAATVRNTVWEAEGFDKEVDRLGREGKVEVVGHESVPYRAGQNVDARMLLLRKR